MNEFVKYLAIVAFGLCIGMSIGAFTSLMNPELSIPWEAFDLPNTPNP